MLIRSLCDYYDIQSARGEAASDIMSEQPVHWMVMLTPDGRVADIIDKRIEESVPQKNVKLRSLLWCLCPKGHRKRELTQILSSTDRCIFSDLIMMQKSVLRPMTRPVRQENPMKHL